jgi:hypothetical protein
MGSEIKSLEFEGETIYIKKSWDGTRLVYPIKKDISKGYSSDNINWKNFLLGGSWSYAIKVAIVMTIIILSLLAYKHDTQVCRDFIRDIDKNCVDYMSIQGGSSDNTQDLVNLSLNSAQMPQDAT